MFRKVSENIFLRENGYYFRFYFTFFIIVITVLGIKLRANVEICKALRAEQCRKMSVEAAKKSLSPWITHLLSNFSKYLSARAKIILPPPKNIIEILPAETWFWVTHVSMLIEALVHSRSRAIYSVALPNLLYSSRKNESNVAFSVPIGLPV